MLMSWRGWVVVVVESMEVDQHQHWFQGSVRRVR
jgi:hypothetical protein